MAWLVALLMVPLMVMDTKETSINNYGSYNWKQKKINGSYGVCPSTFAVVYCLITSVKIEQKLTNQFTKIELGLFLSFGLRRGHLFLIFK